MTRGIIHVPDRLAQEAGRSKAVHFGVVWNEPINSEWSADCPLWCAIRTQVGHYRTSEKGTISEVGVPPHGVRSVRHDQICSSRVLRTLTGNGHRPN